MNSSYLTPQPANADGAADFRSGADGSVSPGAEGPSHQPIHHAIDYLTAALLDVQHIRRATEETAISDELDEQLHRLHGTLQRLGECLLEIRGEPQ